jgi:methionyl-tRNA formyltransferase
MSLNLIFMGTPEFSVPTLKALHDRGHKIVAVYTRVPKPAGRGMKLQPTPVEVEATLRRIPVFTPATLRTPEAEATFRSHEADAAAVVAYGMILPQNILDIPERGCFNLHASLLPRWRGAAPINRAIMEGDTKSGVRVMKMEAGLDTGDVAKIRAKQIVGITNKTTAADLHDELALLGADLMVRAMDALEQHRLHFEKQSDVGIKPAAKIDKAEARIDWNKPARMVLRHIHGLSPFPGAWCEATIDGEVVRLKILRCSLMPVPRRKILPEPGSLLDDHLAVACEEGALRILELQRAGGKPMKAEEFLRGTPIKPPMCLR